MSDIAILGGRGYVGAAITETLRSRDYTVYTLDPNPGGPHHRQVSILDEDALSETIEDVSVVINLVGLSPLRRPKEGMYEKLHVEGARNLITACEENDIERVVHMSAMGADPDAETAFLRTKGRGQQLVTESDLDTTVFRPSVIFDTGNELVQQAEMFAPLRMFPHISTKIQPIYRYDVAELFAAAATGDITDEVLDIAGLDVMTIFAFVEAIYEAKGYRCLPAPLEDVFRAAAPFAEVVPFSPVGVDQGKMLDIDNTTEHNAAPDHLEEMVRYGDWVQDTFGP